MCGSSEPRGGATGALKFLLAVALLWGIDALAGTGPADEIVVIVHKDNAAVIDRGYVQQLYTGAVRGWPDGSPAFVLDQPEGSTAREQFSAGVLGRSPANVRAIWAQNIFTGRGLPPKIAANEEMKRIVSTNRNAIGYIRASQVDASVRTPLR